jgi:hypothetical protein
MLTSTITLWICIGLFFARVVGQLEVLLLAPDWLPPMDAWYSGLLPYPVLLPVQIALLMLMSIVAFRTRAVPQVEGQSIVPPSSCDLWLGSILRSWPSVWVSSFACTDPITTCMEQSPSPFTGYSLYSSSSGRV